MNQVTIKRHRQANGDITACQIRGNGDKTIVIDTALGTCSAEWWHFAAALCTHFRVITFDRLGYGQSSLPGNERKPENIAAELDGLLASLGIDRDIILLGHSQGGYYSMQYALTYPAKVIGMLLLDPATPYDTDFVRLLTREQYKKSGVDKTAGMKLGLFLTSLKLGIMLKPLLKKMPPFYYYVFSKEAEEYLLKSLCRKSTYATALEEYHYTHVSDTITVAAEAIDNQALGNLPVRLITHSSEVYCKELQAFGSMDLKTAGAVEHIWQGIMLRVLNISADAQHFTAFRSGHYIHLTDFELVYDLLLTL